MAKSNGMQGKIVHSISRDILSGKYIKGENLPSPTTLAELFGVGQSVVREAISVLKANGLVEVRRGRNGGVVVVDKSIEILSNRLLEQMLMGKVTVEQAAKMRLLLEVDGCRTGTPTVEENVVKRLRELDDGMSIATNYDDFNRFNDDFHVTIGMMGGNNLQGIILRLLMSFVGRAAELVSPDFRSMHSIDEHARIINAIEKKDAERACHYLCEHITKAYKRIEEQKKGFFSRAAGESLYDKHFVGKISQRL